MKYKVILLDADRTLFDYDKAQYHALVNTYSFLNKTFSNEELEKYRVINDALWLDFEKGKVTMDKLKTERFRRLFKDEKLAYNEISEVYLKHLGEGSFELDGASQVCAVLSKKYKLVILTNGITSVQRNRLKKSSLVPYISAIITSEETGYQKPDPALFDFTLRQIGHQDKNSVLMVGDSLSSDIMGGIQAGIDTCWYNSREEKRPEKIKPTYEIKKLEELLDILE